MKSNYLHVNDELYANGIIKDDSLYSEKLNEKYLEIFQ